MTEEERKQEGADESIEDLEAPAAAIADVAGGVGTACSKPTCLNQSSVSTFCQGITCGFTMSRCDLGTASVVVLER
jgi:hypothetical protein